MAEHPPKEHGSSHKSDKKTRATLPASRKKVSAKISKVARDHPEKSQKQVVGMALGILRNEKNE